MDRRQSPAEQGLREDGAYFAVWSITLPACQEGSDGQGVLGGKEGNGRIKSTELPCFCSLSQPLSSPWPSLLSLDVHGSILPQQAGMGVYQLKAIYFEIQLPDFPSFVYF